MRAGSPTVERAVSRLRKGSMREKIAAEAQLRAATERFLAECAQATQDQWRLHPSPGHWSMADVAEHVVVSNGNILRLLSRRLLECPIGTRTVDVTDAEIPYLFYRGEEPPDVAAPTGALRDREAAAEALDASARSILDWAGSVTVDLRSVGIAHPVFGLLDGIQWLSFAGAHVERHRAQLIGLRRRLHRPV